MNGIDPTAKAAAIEAVKAAIAESGASRVKARSAPPGGEGTGGIKRAAEDFEALFINQMLKSMRETVVKTDLFHGGAGEDIYTSMMDMEMSTEMARGGGIGLSEVLLKHFSGSPGAPARDSVERAEKGTGVGTPPGAPNGVEPGASADDGRGNG